MGAIAPPAREPEKNIFERTSENIMPRYLYPQNGDRVVTS